MKSRVHTVPSFNRPQIECSTVPRLLGWGFSFIYYYLFINLFVRYELFLHLHWLQDSDLSKGPFWLREASKDVAIRYKCKALWISPLRCTPCLVFQYIVSRITKKCRYKTFNECVAACQCACAVHINVTWLWWCDVFAELCYAGRGNPFLVETQWKQSSSKWIHVESDGPSKWCELPPRKQRW